MWWRQRRWRALLELLNQLPPASRLTQALLDDPEEAERLASAAQAQAKWTPPTREWDTDAVLLAEIRDRLVEVAQAVASLGGQKPRRVKPFPRPVTEVDRAKQRLSEQAQAEVIALFAPHARR